MKKIIFIVLACLFTVTAFSQTQKEIEDRRKKDKEFQEIKEQIYGKFNQIENKTYTGAQRADTIAKLKAEIEEYKIKLDSIAICNSCDSVRKSRSPDQDLLKACGEFCWPKEKIPTKKE